jgi:ATP-dependent Clp protease ATP-binding subunit ClpA
MLSRELEATLHRSLRYANERHHQYATLEHLLGALTEDPEAIPVLLACGADVDRLRREVLNYLDNELANLVDADSDDAKPTASFQRVLQRAAIHVQSSGREEVTGANVLVAIFAEREKPRSILSARTGPDSVRCYKLYTPRDFKSPRTIRQHKAQRRRTKFVLNFRSSASSRQNISKVLD